MGDNHAPVTVPKRVVRKDDPEFIKCGFRMAGSDAELKALCFECGEVLSLPTLFFLFFFFISHLMFDFSLIYLGMCSLEFYIKSRTSVPKG